MSQLHRPIDIHCKPVCAIHCRDIVFIDGNRSFQIAYQIAGNHIHCRIFRIGRINECNHTHDFIIWKIATAQSHSSSLLGTKAEKSIGRIITGDQICGRPRFKCVVAIYGWNIGHIGQRVSVNNNTLICHKILGQILRENNTGFEFDNIGNINGEISALFIN